MARALEREGPLDRRGQREANALELKHADFRRPSARRRKASQLAARGEDTMTGDDQRDRILRHRRSDVTRNLGTRADVLRQGAVGCRSAPAYAPRGLIDLLEERVLVAKVEPDAGKIRLFASEVTRRGGDRRGDFREGFSRRRFGARRSSRLSADLALVAGNWKRTTPNSLHAIAQKPAAVSKIE